MTFYIYWFVGRTLQLKTRVLDEESGSSQATPSHWKRPISKSCPHLSILTGTRGKDTPLFRRQSKKDSRNIRSCKTWWKSHRRTDWCAIFFFKLFNQTQLSFVAIMYDLLTGERVLKIFEWVVKI